MSDTEAREAATEAGDASASAADALVSYVCGTLTTGTTLTHESMSEHDPSGTTLCVHSVVTCGSSRREGNRPRRRLSVLPLGRDSAKRSA